MAEPIWRFRRKQRNEVHQDPVNTEFFAQQDVADRLVRESGQNTLDARADKVSPARLVLSITSARSKVWGKYFSTLWPHLEAHRQLRERLPSANDDIPVLLVEDFGTTGLTGPLERNGRLGPDDAETDYRLFWFFKNVGRTSKTGEQLGSYGIGKTVFPYSSRINTYFGLSVRDPVGDESRAILLGQSQLKEHYLQGEEEPCDPFGFYALHEDQTSSYEQKEITDMEALQAFKSHFGLRRELTESGLSVVIPYPEEGLEMSDLTRSVVRQFFLPILSGQLEVEIYDANSSLDLRASTLLDSIDSLRWPHDEARPLRKRIELARWALSQGRTKLVKTNRPAVPRTPRFEESMLPQQTRRELSTQLLSGDRIAVRVPVPVEPKRAELTWSYVDVFLELDGDGTNREDIYAREGLTIVDHDGQARQRGLRSILLAQEPWVAALLRASENVSHTRWRQRGAQKLVDEFERGPSKVTYVLGIVPALVQALLSPEEEADWWTYATLFPALESSPIPQAPIDSTDNGKPKPDDDDETSPVEDPDADIPDDLKRKTRQWVANPLADGVRINGNPDFAGQLKPMLFDAAYGLPNRKAFRSHNEADFSFHVDKDSMIQSSNAHVTIEGPNVLRILPKGGEFEVRITGFDRHRALDYRVKVLEE